MMVPALDYIPGLIAAYKAGHARDHVHLGYWPEGATYGWQAAQDAMTDLHLDALDLRDGTTLVDIGCGIGGSLRMANARLRDSKLIGVNIDPRQIAICRQQRGVGGNEVSWIQSDAGQVPLPDYCVDRILSLEAMFHFPERAMFIEEASRLLRPGGRLVCSDILFDTPHDAETARWCDVVVQGYAPWPEPVLTASSVAALAENAGLRVLDYRDIAAEVAPTWGHIVSGKDDPDTSPAAAMGALQDSRLLHYPIFTFEKPHAPN